MDTDLKEVFENKLIELYGEFKPMVSKFGISSFGKISAELCISPSQFSKLISGSATEGMYMRSIKNIEQLIEYQRILKNNKQLKKELSKTKKTPVKPPLSKLKIIIITPIVLACLFIGYAVAFSFFNQKVNSITNNNKHPLSLFFNKSEKQATDVGYLNEDEVKDYCPSSAYEGKWKLAKTYKIPLPGTKKPGVYLFAKTADITMVSAKYATNKGRVLLGFEHLTHEIWVDKTRQSLVPEYFNPTTKTFTKLYNQLEFHKDKRFVKIASIKSFYLDEFTINKDFITRKGQPNGRYINEIDKELAKKYDIDVDYLLHEVISNLTKTKCNTTINKYSNPNTLKVNSTISFNCFYSIDMENLGFGGEYPYTKTIQFVSQNYSDNLMCDCFD